MKSKAKLDVIFNPIILKTFEVLLRKKQARLKELLINVKPQEEFNISAYTYQYLLNRLVELGILKAEKNGKRYYIYSIDQKLEEAVKELLKVYNMFNSLVKLS